MNLFTSLFTAIGSRRKTIYTIALIVLVGIAALSYRAWEKSRYAALYAAYTEAAHVQENAAFLPGDIGNPVRNTLNTTLSRALDTSTSKADRLALARDGIMTIDTLNKQIDGVGASAPAVAQAVAAIQAQARSPFEILGRKELKDIAALANQQMALAEEIRGLSYRANFETLQIFNRIIADKGALTPAYITELNNEIPKVEAEFNQRTNRYQDLQGTMSHIEADFSTLTPTSQ